MRLSIIFITMSVQEEVGREGGLRERNRSATQRRIADAAVRLAAEQGVSGTTVDQISRAAGVGRATFFRHFDSKELAVATGLSDAGAYVLAGVLADIPSSAGPLDAVRAAYARLGEGFDGRRQMFLEQARLSRSSPAMFAWTLYLYGDWEVTVAEAVAPRFADLRPGDPRPRMLGALVMAAARLACDVWVADEGRGDLPTLIQQYLGTIEIADRPAPTTSMA